MVRTASDVIAIGASAGGVEALRGLLPCFRADLDAAILVVLHRGQQTVDHLAAVLEVGSRLPVRIAIDGERVCRGNVYVAPAQVHMVVGDGRIALDASMTRSASRSGIDSLFRSVARDYGTRAIAVVLSGMLSDGAAGMRDVHRYGGLTIVQDPVEAAQAEMPTNAMHHGRVHHCVDLREIADIASLHLESLVRDFPSHPRVLLAASDTEGAHLLEQRLSELGYDIVASVASGDQALAEVARELPDVVLMDVRLDGAMHGTEAARLIHERFAIPVVYLTAYTDEQTLIAVRSSSSYGFIVKPCAMAQIHATLGLALHRRQLEGRRAPAPTH